MSENPDNKDYEGLGPQAKQQDSEGNEMSIDQRHLFPSNGMLRFVERETPTTKPVRILQQYQWSHTLGDHGWFDIPMVEDD